jgi:hypothetical protein
MPHRGSDFLAMSPDGQVRLSLTRVEPLPVQPHAPRAQPFTLVFVGPPEPVLPQRIHHLGHPVLGTLAVFLVPIGYNDAGSVLYEAVFN